MGGAICRKRLVATVLLIAAVAHAEPLRLESFLAEVEARSPAIRAAKEHGGALALRVAPAGMPEDPFFAVGPDDVPCCASAVPS